LPRQDSLFISSEFETLQSLAFPSAAIYKQSTPRRAEGQFWCVHRSFTFPNKKSVEPLPDAREEKKYAKS
jgi:hypothetical protein